MNPHKWGLPRQGKIMQTLKTDTRKRILEVSKRLFLKKGFRATTTRDIARDEGINLSKL